MSDVKVYTFNIGQGLFNLLTEETAHKKFCAIFDCGTLNTSYPVIEENLNLAVQIINEFGGLDLIVISHQDKDHWSLCMELLVKYYKLEPNQWYFNENNNMYIKYMDKNFFVETLSKSDDWFVLHEYSYVSQNGECRLYFKDNQKILYSNYYVKDKPLSYKIYDNDIDIQIDNINKTYTLDNISDLRKDLGNIMLFYSINGCIRQDKACYINNTNIIPPDNCLNTNINIPEIILGGSSREVPYLNFIEKLKFFGDIIEMEEANCRHIDYKGSIKHDILGFSIQPQKIEHIKNATSTISVYQYDNSKSIIFPGDATYHVFDSLCEKIYVSAPVELLIAPHHGSFDTNILVDDNGNLLPDDNQPFLHFLSVIQPKAVFISALLSKFGHPDLKFLEYVSKFAQSSYPHKIVYKNKSISDKNKENEIIKYVKKKAVFSTESNSNKYLLFPDILHRAVNELSKPQENNFILPPDDLFI